MTSPLKQWLASRSQFPWLTLVEWLAIVAIIVVLVALLIPPVQWASSGDIEFPVRVRVFDAATAEPIAGARVAVIRGPHVASELESYRDFFPGDWFDHLTPEKQGLTGADGSAVVVYTFKTGASNRNPTPRAHLGNAWAVVKSKGYGGTAVPVRHNSIPTSELRRQNELLVLIGLLRSDD